MQMNNFDIHAKPATLLFIYIFAFSLELGLLLELHLLAHASLWT